MPLINIFKFYNRILNYEPNVASIFSSFIVQDISHNHSNIVVDTTNDILNKKKQTKKKLICFYFMKDTNKNSILNKWRNYYL
jgi:hypothetical protein